MADPYLIRVVRFTPTETVLVQVRVRLTVPYSYGYSTWKLCIFNEESSPNNLSRLYFAIKYPNLEKFTCSLSAHTFNSPSSPASHFFYYSLLSPQRSSQPFFLLFIIITTEILFVVHSLLDQAYSWFSSHPRWTESAFQKFLVCQTRKRRQFRRKTLRAMRILSRRRNQRTKTLF